MILARHFYNKEICNRNGLNCPPNENIGNYISFYFLRSNTVSFWNPRINVSTFMTCTCLSTLRNALLNVSAIACMEVTELNTVPFSFITNVCNLLTWCLAKSKSMLGLLILGVDFSFESVFVKNRIP